MKTIEVVSAIITNSDKYLIAKRNYGKFEGMWEFPGGKIELNESNEDALIREIKEELNDDITINNFCTTIEVKYPKFNLIMHNYFATLNSTISLSVHDEYQWINLDEFDNFDLLEADILVFKYLKELSLIK